MGVMMKYFLAAFFFIITGYTQVVANTALDKVIVLKYRDFGPQCISYELIGFDWWQWDKCSDQDQNYKYDIKVIVYRDIPLEDIVKLYPVIKSKKQDYRYLPYNKALYFLNTNIKENLLPDVTNLLFQTREIIIKRLGDIKD